MSHSHGHVDNVRVRVSYRPRTHTPAGNDFLDDRRAKSMPSTATRLSLPLPRYLKA